MKREDLKKMLKPLVQECVREALYEGGLLSGNTYPTATGRTCSTSKRAGNARKKRKSQATKKATA